MSNKLKTIYITINKSSELSIKDAVCQYAQIFQQNKLFVCSEEWDDKVIIYTDEHEFIADLIIDMGQTRYYQDDHRMQNLINKLIKTELSGTSNHDQSGDLQKLFHKKCIQVESLSFDWFDIKKTNSSYFFQIFYHSNYEWVRIDLLNKLYPNIDEVAMCRCMLTSSTLYDILNHLKNSKTEIKELEITAVNETNELKLLCAQFKNHFIAINFALKIDKYDDEEKVTTVLIEQNDLSNELRQNEQQHAYDNDAAKYIDALFGQFGCHLHGNEVEKLSTCDFKCDLRNAVASESTIKIFVAKESSNQSVANKDSLYEKMRKNQGCSYNALSFEKKWEIDIEILRIFNETLNKIQPRINRMINFNIRIPIPPHICSEDNDTSSIDQKQNVANTTDQLRISGFTELNEKDNEWTFYAGQSPQQKYRTVQRHQRKFDHQQKKVTKCYKSYRNSKKKFSYHRW
eukprot:224685_1